MKLIADSGSTKTDWALIDNAGKIEYQKTGGINPYLHELPHIESTINEVFENLDYKAIEAVHFYGSGCGSESNRKKIRKAFEKLSEIGKLEVESDLIGAAYALCGSSPGMVGILGTGSNAAFFDGSEMIVRFTSLGYLAGDEGSATHIGKRLLRAFAYGSLSFHEYEEMKAGWGGPEEIVKKIYGEANPNRIFADLSRWALSRIKKESIKKVIQQSFTEFIEIQLKAYPEVNKYPVHFTGSVAWFGKELISDLLTDLNITPGNFVRSPIEGLVEYHITENLPQE